MSSDSVGVMDQRTYSGWGFGDPHFTTLDGRSYTFNGWGEYILLDIDDSISIQARTELVPNTQATQFSAIAVGTVYDKVEVGNFILWLFMCISY